MNPPHPPIHARPHTYIHTACTHAHTHTDTHACTHARMHARTPQGKPHAYVTAFVYFKFFTGYSCLAHISDDERKSRMIKTFKRLLLHRVAIVLYNVILTGSPFGPCTPGPGLPSLPWRHMTTLRIHSDHIYTYTTNYSTGDINQ